MGWACGWTCGLDMWVKHPLKRVSDCDAMLCCCVSQQQTLDMMASLPTRSNSFVGANLQAAIGVFASDLCSTLLSPRMPPAPLPPTLPPALQTGEPSPPPATACSDVCQFAGDGECDVILTPAH